MYGTVNISVCTIHVGNRIPMKGSEGWQSSRSFKEALLIRVRKEAVKVVRSDMNQ